MYTTCSSGRTYLVSFSYVQVEEEKRIYTSYPKLFHKQGVVTLRGPGPSGAGLFHLTCYQVELVDGLVRLVFVGYRGMFALIVDGLYVLVKRWRVEILCTRHQAVGHDVRGVDRLRWLDEERLGSRCRYRTYIVRDSNMLLCGCPLRITSASPSTPCCNLSIKVHCALLCLLHVAAITSYGRFIRLGGAFSTDFEPIKTIES